mgnify:CR=1 FL=1
MNKVNFCNKIEFDQYFKNASFDMGEQIELLSQMNIWKLEALIWVNKMNFCNKIDILSILQKCKFWYHWTNWTVVTDEYLKISSSNLGEKIEIF